MVLGVRCPDRDAHHYVKSSLSGWTGNLDLCSGQSPKIKSDSLISACFLKYGSQMWSQCYATSEHNSLGVFKLRLRPGAAFVIMESDITKHRHYVFCFYTDWGTSEHSQSYCTDDFLTGTLPQTSKLLNRPHEDSWTTVCCITDPLPATITMSVCLKPVLLEYGAPLMYLDHVLRFAGS